MKLQKKEIELLTRWFKENLERVDGQPGQKYGNGVESNNWTVSFKVEFKTIFQQFKGISEKDE